MFLRYQVFFGLFFFFYYYFFKFSVSCIFAAAALYRCAWDGRECAGIAQSVVIAVPLQLVLLPVQQPGVHGSFTRFCSGHRSKSDWWFLPGAPHCSKAQKTTCFGTCKTAVCAQERPKQNFTQPTQLQGGVHVACG